MFKKNILHKNLLKNLLKIKIIFFLLFLIPILLLTGYTIKKFFLKKKTSFTTKDITEKKEPNTPEIIIKNFCIQEKNKNNTDSWILKSKKSKIFKKTNVIECNDASCTLKKNDKEFAILKSHKSLLDRNKNQLFLYGPVTGNYKDLRLEGKEINYNFSNQTIDTKNNLRYFYPNFKLNAQESFFDLKLNRIEMKNGIRCEITPNP